MVLAHQRINSGTFTQYRGTEVKSPDPRAKLLGCKSQTYYLLAV